MTQTACIFTTGPNRYNARLAAAIASFAFVAFCGAGQPNPVAPKQPAQPPVVAAKKLTIRPTSPVTYFRELLAMTPAQRQLSMAGQPPEQKRILIAKLKEYESLPAGVRELRLRQTQRRWYLLELMKRQPAERVPMLASIPAEDRDAVAEQLHEWDKLQPELQKRFLDHQTAIELWMRFQNISPDQKKALLDNYSVERRKSIEQELARWQALPAPEQLSMIDCFRRFFEQNNREQNRTLSALSETERKQMEATLKSFAQLSPEQRRHCIEAFQRFAEMAPAHRAEFLKNAAQWELMSPQERKLWRELVQRLPSLPPSPPGMDPNEPPLPPGWRPNRDATSVAGQQSLPSVPVN